jgi:hypothetical protein
VGWGINTPHEHLIFPRRTLDHGGNSLSIRRYRHAIDPDCIQQFVDAERSCLPAFSVAAASAAITP